MLGAPQPPHATVSDTQDMEKQSGGWGVSTDTWEPTAPKSCLVLFSTYLRGRPTEELRAMLSVRIGMGAPLPTPAPKTTATPAILPLPGVIGVLHHRRLRDTNSPGCPRPPPSPGRNPITLRVPCGQQDRPGTHPAPLHPNITGRASPGALAAAKPHAPGPGRPHRCHLSPRRSAGG